MPGENIEWDIAVIGGGTAGYSAAIHAAHLGARVALIEKSELGGTCLNRGCIPTKTLIRSVEALQEIKRASDFGLEIEGGVRTNFQKIMARKSDVVSNLVAGISRLMKANKISVFKGAGYILSPNRVNINEIEITTRNIVIATGSEPARLSIQGAELPGVFNTDNVLELTELPGDMVIIGGGYVGAELAGIFNGLGTRVSIIEMLPLCLANCDEEIYKFFNRILRKQRIEVKTGAAVKAIVPDGERVKVIYTTPQGEQAISGQVVLVATGRRPYVEGLGLAGLGIAREGPAIRVDDYLKTNIPGVYAAGDVTGKTMLAHVASYQGEVAVENIMGISRRADYRAVPSCIFTIPEMASVGLTEMEVKKAGLEYRVTKFPFSACGRAMTMGEINGMVKMICSSGDGRVLGLHIIGPRASDLIAEGTLAIRMGATAEDIAHTIHAHPTLAEAVHEAAMAQLHGPIHAIMM